MRASRVGATLASESRNIELAAAPLWAAAIIALLTVVLSALAWRLFAIGYHIKP